MLLCLCFRTWNYWNFLILLTVTSFAWWSCWKNVKLWSQTPLLVSHLRCPAPRLCLVSAQAQQMWAKESEFRAFLQSTGTHFAHGLIGEKICCQTGSLEAYIDKLRSIGIWGKGCWITSWFDSAQAPQLWFRHSRQGPDHGRLQAVSGLDAGRLGPNEGHRTLIIFVFHTKDLDKWGAFVIFVPDILPIFLDTLGLLWSHIHEPSQWARWHQGTGPWAMLCWGYLSQRDWSWKVHGRPLALTECWCFEAKPSKTGRTPYQHLSTCRRGRSLKQKSWG